MTHRTAGRRMLAVLATTGLLLALAAMPAASLGEDPGLLLVEHTFAWTDPTSGGEATVTEQVWLGCDAPGSAATDMTWRYIVENIDFDPQPTYTNGISGFQLIFPGPVPELYGQTAPSIGGPWDMNAYSGTAPPYGAEWDSPDDPGIMPGEHGTFSFCTAARVDVVVDSSAGAGAGPAGWMHSWGFATFEPIVDSDGSTTAGVGDPTTVQVRAGDALTTWPTGFSTEGLDWFDNDDSCTWTAGDDLHVEGSDYATAQRDGFHDDGAFFDPVVLDLNGNLTDGQQVDVDLETGTSFTGCSGPDPALRFRDTNVNGNWDEGEDIVLDQNQNGTFGSLSTAQSFIFHGHQSVPGALVEEYAKVSGAIDDPNAKGKGHGAPLYTFGGWAGAAADGSVIGVLHINYKTLGETCTFTPGTFDLSAAPGIGVTDLLRGDLFGWDNSCDGTADIYLLDRDASPAYTRGAIYVDATDNTYDIDINPAINDGPNNWFGIDRGNVHVVDMTP